MTKDEAERLVDNSFQRILFMASSTGAHTRLVESIETERSVAKAAIRQIQCAIGGGPREGGTVEVGGS